MREEKKLLLDEIKQKIDASKAMIIARYDRLPPNLSWDFRDRLVKSGSALEIVRKRVFLKAAEMSGMKIEEALLPGHIGVIFVKEADVAPAAKAVLKFSEENQNIVSIVCGQVEGEAFSGADLEMLSKLPALPEMRAELLATLESPMSQLLTIFEAVMAEPLSILEQKS